MAVAPHVEPQNQIAPSFLLPAKRVSFPFVSLPPRSLLPGPGLLVLLVLLVLNLHILRV